MSRTQEKHKAIIKTAKMLFLKQGFSVTSMDQIAEVAKISKKTIYHHFPDKTTLFQNVVANHWKIIIESKEPLFNEKKSIEKNLKEFARILLNFLTSKQTLDIIHLLIAESKRFPELSKLLLSENRAPFTKHLILYLTNQVNKGKLDIPDIELASYQFLGLIKERCFWLRFFGVPKSSQKEMNEMINRAVAMFLLYYKRQQFPLKSSGNC